MARLGRVTPPVAVTVKSGSVLGVHFTFDRDRATHVALEGEAVVLFEGQLRLEAFGF
jgi:diaminopimelate epimerase